MDMEPKTALDLLEIGRDMAWVTANYDAAKKFIEKKADDLSLVHYQLMEILLGRGAADQMDGNLLRVFVFLLKLYFELGYLKGAQMNEDKTNLKTLEEKLYPNKDA